MMNNLRQLVAVARGHESADIIFTNAMIVNTLSGDIEEGNVAICDDRIAGIGDYRDGKEIIDLKGKYLVPTFIDGHVHIESSMLHISRYAEAVVPRGVCGIVTDLHEIANVKGIEGVKYMIECSRDLPLDCYFMSPSCVPATHLETAGAMLSAPEVVKALKGDRTIGLGEVMNFPGVLAADPGVIKKIIAADGKIIDGHAPGLKGKDLNAYIACGIMSDHESTALDEAREKLRRGMFIMIREGSSEKNLEALLPLVTDRTYKRCMFVVDDRSCSDLKRDGEIDGVVRKAISLGMDPVRAIQLATINTAEYFRISRAGAIAPGYAANVFITPDLISLEAERVYHDGRLVAENGKALFASSVLKGDEMTHTMHVKPYNADALAIPAEKANYPIIEIVPDQILTRKSFEKPKVNGKRIVSDIDRDIVKLAVIERHKATGNIGLAMIKGLGIKRGALASSIAHDSHNIICAGVDDEDIYAASREVERLGGGLVVADGGRAVESLPLPIAGLLSDEPIEVVVDKMERMESAARRLGTGLASPFATLSFLALPVIPELRLSDMGLVDVTEFRIMN